MSKNQNILFLLIAITALAITLVALKVPAVEGQVVFGNSNTSQTLIVDPFGQPDQVSPPPAILAPDPTTVLSNEQVTIPLVKPAPQGTNTPKVQVTPSNFNPPYEVCQTDQVQQVASVAVYKLKGKADLNELSSVIGKRQLQIQLEVTLRPAADFVDVNDIIDATMRYTKTNHTHITLDNQSFKTQCINDAGSPTLNVTTLSLQQKVQNNPPFRQCSTLTAPTVHAIYTIKFDERNIDNVFKVDQGMRDFEITLTNNLVTPTPPTGTITVGDDDTDLGSFEVNSICEMTAT